MIKFVLDNIPDSDTKNGIIEVYKMDDKITVQEVAKKVGSGYSVISQDTVPFSIWCASKFIENFEESMWTTVSGLGDRDTTCAIVGSIVSCSKKGYSTIPLNWLKDREPLKIKEWDPLPKELENIDIYDKDASIVPTIQYEFEEN